MKRIAYAAPLALLLTLCLGCNYYQAADKRSADSAAVAGPLPTPVPAPDDPDRERQIVKTAELRMVVKDFNQFTRRLHDAVKQSGGYISQEDQAESVSEISNSVTIKVPVANFEDLMTLLPADSDRLIAKKITFQDMTTAGTDGPSRPGHSMAYSTMNLHFYQVLPPAPVEKAPSFARRFADAVGDGWGALSDALLGMVRVWPLLIGFGLVVYGIRRWMHGTKMKPAGDCVKSTAPASFLQTPNQST